MGKTSAKAHKGASPGGAKGGAGNNAQKGSGKGKQSAGAKLMPQHKSTETTKLEKGKGQKNKVGRVSAYMHVRCRCTR